MAANGTGMKMNPAYIGIALTLALQIVGWVYAFGQMQATANGLQLQVDGMRGEISAMRVEQNNLYRLLLAQRDP